MDVMENENPALVEVMRTGATFAKAVRALRPNTHEVRMLYRGKGGYKVALYNEPRHIIPDTTILFDETEIAMEDENDERN